MIDTIFQTLLTFTLIVSMGIIICALLYTMLKAIVVTITTEQLMKELGNDYLELKNIDKVKLRNK